MKTGKNIVCIVQARMSSSRLPGKMMKPLAGLPNIEQVFRQLSFSKKISNALLATSTDLSDDKLFEWSAKRNIACYRGSLNDVLDRFYQTAKKAEADVLVRVTGDCPLIDPEIVDKVIEMHFENGFDYTSNVDPPSFPDGYDVEVFDFNALEKAWKESVLKSDREHVTPFIRNSKSIYKTGNLSSGKNLEHIRVTLDNEEDYKLISLIYENLFNEKSYINLDSVLDFIEKNPVVLEINKNIKRNEGYNKSTDEDNITK